MFYCPNVAQGSPSVSYNVGKSNTNDMTGVKLITKYQVPIGATTLSITALSITTLSIMSLFVTLGTNDTELKWQSAKHYWVPNAVILSVAFFYCYAECHYAKCRYAECHYAEYRYAECRGACQSNKTFYGCNLQIFVISYSVCPWQVFPAQSNVCG